jgi:ketosteroid isomerase-like protein
MAIETTSLERLPAEMYRLLDDLEIGAVAALLTADAQGIDEISRTWVRGRTALEAYLDEIRLVVGDLRSTIRDLEVVAWGDTGAVTFVLEQTYSYDGRRTRITCPTTFVCRREDGRWKIAVMHSMPLPEEAEPL